jgi:hypothetical protein
MVVWLPEDISLAEAIPTPKPAVVAQPADSPKGN